MEKKGKKGASFISRKKKKRRAIALRHRREIKKKKKRTPYMRLLEPQIEAKGREKE